MIVSQNLLAEKIKLEEIYKIKEDEFITFADNCESELYGKIKTGFFNELRNFPNIQIDNFKKDFWYKDGIPKVWNKLSVSEIKYSYDQNSNKYRNTFPLLKTLKVIEHPLKLIDYGKIPREEIEKFENEKIPEILNDPNINYEKLLDDNSLNNYINKYDDGIKEIYDEAIRRNQNIRSTHIPLWAWILLIYVGYKDVWRLFTGHWLILLLLISGLYALLRMVGLGSAPMMIINLIKEQIKMLYSKQKMD